MTILQYIRCVEDSDKGFFVERNNSVLLITQGRAIFVHRGFCANDDREIPYLLTCSVDIVTSLEERQSLGHPEG